MPSGTLVARLPPPEPKCLKRELSRFIAQGEWLRGRCLAGESHPPVHQSEDWLDATAEYLIEQLGQDLANVDFLEQADFEGEEGGTPVWGRLLNRIDCRCARLRSLLEGVG